MDRAGHRGGGGACPAIHAARPAAHQGNAHRRTLGHPDARIQHAEHLAARRGNLGSPPGGPGDQRRGHGPVRQTRPGLPPVPDHVRGTAAGLGGGAGRRRMRGGRGGPLAAGGQLPTDMAEEYERSEGLQGPAGQAAERLVLVRADSVLAARRQDRERGAGRKWERKSPGCSSSRAPRTTPPGCCGASSARSCHGPVCLAAAYPAARVVRNIGIVLAVLVLPALVAFLSSAWSDPAKRRTIGVLWDVGTFWPRSYHPLSPPCYTERASPTSSAGCGGCTTTTAGSSWSGTARARSWRPRHSSSPAAVPQMTSGPDHVRLPGGQALQLGLPRLLRRSLSGRWCQAAGRRTLAQLLLPDRPHRRAGTCGLPEQSRHRWTTNSSTRPTATSSTGSHARVQGALRLLGRRPRMEADQRTGRQRKGIPPARSVAEPTLASDGERAGRAGAARA